MDLIHALRLKIDCESLQVNSTVENIKLPPDFQEYEDLFSPGLGCASGFVHKVNVRKDVTPVQAKLRRLPFAIRQSVSKELARLEKDGAIEPINSSEWISP